MLAVKIGRIGGENFRLGLTDIIDQLGFVVDNLDIALKVFTSYLCGLINKVTSLGKYDKSADSPALPTHHTPAAPIIITARGRPTLRRGTVYVPPSTVVKHTEVVTTPDGVDLVIPHIHVTPPALTPRDYPSIMITAPQLESKAQFETSVSIPTDRLTPHDFDGALEIKPKPRKITKSSVMSVRPASTQAECPISIITGKPIRTFHPSVSSCDSDSEDENDSKANGHWDSQRSLEAFRLDLRTETGLNVGPHRIETETAPMFGWEFKGFRPYAFGQWTREGLAYAYEKRMEVEGRVEAYDNVSYDRICAYLASLTDEEANYFWLLLRRNWHEHKWQHLAPLNEDSPVLVLTPPTPELEPSTPESSPSSVNHLLLTPPEFSLGRRYLDDEYTMLDEDTPTSTSTTQFLAEPVYETTFKVSVDWNDLRDDDSLMVFPDTVQQVAPTSALGLMGIGEDV